MRAADNPFAAHRVLRERYRLEERGWSRLLERLHDLRFRAAIVGPKGSGKTTLLEDLAARLQAQRHGVRLIRWSATHRRLPDLSEVKRDELLLCDGAEQLTRLDWWRLRLYSRRAAGIVVTTHHDGLLPTLHRCETSPALLRDVVGSLGVRLEGDRCAELHERCRGNIRDALRLLYDEMAAGSDTSRPSERALGHMT